MKRRVLILAGRKFEDGPLIGAVLTAIRPNLALLIELGRSPSDHYVRTWGNDQGIPVATFHAPWRGLGRASYRVRDEIMLHSVKIDLVLAFPEAGGVKHLCQDLKMKGLDVREVTRPKFLAST